MSRLGETRQRVCHPQVDQFVDFFNIMMYECATSGESDGQLNAEIFWDPTNPDPWECQPGGAANEAVNIFLQEGVAPSQLNMGTLSTVISIQMCRNYLENARPQTRRKTEPARAFRLTIRNLFQTANQSKGLAYLLRPDCAGAVYAARGRHAGFITYDDEVSTYTRVWYSDWQWNLGGVFMWSIDADYDGQTQDLLDQAYLASLPPVN